MCIVLGIYIHQGCDQNKQRESAHCHCTLQALAMLI
jgi:hypothetical protein